MLKARPAVVARSGSLQQRIRGSDLVVDTGGRTSQPDPQEPTAGDDCLGEAAFSRSYFGLDLYAGPVPTLVRVEGSHEADAGPSVSRRPPPAVATQPGSPGARHSLGRIARTCPPARRAWDRFPTYREWCRSTSGLSARATARERATCRCPVCPPGRRCGLPCCHYSGPRNWHRPTGRGALTVRGALAWFRQLGSP